ncbi:MAG: hypothetical protein AAGF46_00735 [Pseudomonadota bacterium]
MIKLGTLARIAQAGFADMRPALVRAFNDSPHDDHLNQVFGTNPRLTIVLLSLAGLVSGRIIMHFAANFWPWEEIHWAAILASVMLALPVRRYLFRSDAVSDADFPWIAAAIIPAVGLGFLLGLADALAVIDERLIEDAPLWTRGVTLAVCLAQATAVGATVALGYAALCYSRRWHVALWELVWLLLLLKLTLWFFETILLEIGILDAILSAIIESIFGVTFPDWLGDVSDQISFALLVFALYLAMIGATWTVCQQSFGELLTTGEVNIVRTVRRMLDPPDEKKEAKKAEKKAARAARKAARKR